ncbi:hypothetical protein OQA88_9790 [Cercophora sp. LCS_1]
MDHDVRQRHEIKAEDDDTRMGDDRVSYKSWKKKYRKMRIVFDQKMHDGEELHKLEQKALATARRLAVEKDRLLDLLLDVNNSGQIPPEKRFDLSLDPPSDPNTPFLDIDRPSTPPGGAPPAKSYKRLCQEVPHFTFSSANERFRDLLNDLEAGRDSPADPAQGQPHPPSFLTADDIDNYLWEVDVRLAEKEYNKTGNMPVLLPTMAPLAHAAENKELQTNSRDFLLRNPTSVYNWLRKNCPNTFLQDGEHEKENGDEQHVSTGRRGKGERGGRQGGPARTKRQSTAHHKGKDADAMDYDEDTGYDAVTPSGAGAKGKRKRVVDDDPGYRPKGGSSRPTKKKRKSEGVEATPSGGPKKARKSAGADD